MKERIRVKEVDLKCEAHWITQFVLNHIVEVKTVKGIPIGYLFERYQEFIKRRYNSGTQLSVDGFGRMFPKHYQRRSICKDGKAMKGVAGISLI